jgi:hypothetical protein
MGPLSEEAAAIGVGREALVMAAAASLAATEPAADADADTDTDTDTDTDAEFTGADSALPAAVIDATHDPLGATALALGLLVARDDNDDAHSNSSTAAACAVRPSRCAYCCRRCGNSVPVSAFRSSPAPCRH